MPTSEQAEALSDSVDCVETHRLQWKLRLLAHRLIPAGRDFNIDV